MCICSRLNFHRDIYHFSLKLKERERSLSLSLNKKKKFVCGVIERDCGV